MANGTKANERLIPSPLYYNSTGIAASIPRVIFEGFVTAWGRVEAPSHRQAVLPFVFGEV